MKQACKADQWLPVTVGEGTVEIGYKGSFGGNGNLKLDYSKGCGNL